MADQDAWRAPEVVRKPEPFTGDERATLEGFLEWHRTTLLHKCAGLTGEQLTRQSVPPSHLSLLGIVRHITEVERNYFRRRLAGQTVDRLYSSPDNPQGAFEDLDPAGAETDIAALIAEWELCRQAVAGISLDATYLNPRFGEMSLRWIYNHLNGEYSQHNGHADLLRERIDGVTGS